MAERRSGIDLVYCRGGWAVMFGEQLLALCPMREEAIVRAREESRRILLERRVTNAPLDPIAYPRLRSRRQVRHQAVVSEP